MGRFFTPTDVIQFAVKERVARITLNRPEKRNALNPAIIQALHDALIEADARDDVNVVVLQGAGKDFCAGYDLAGVYAGRKSEADNNAEAEVSYRTSIGTFDNDCWSLEFTQRRIMALFDLHKPVIARVHGNCLAGGTDLALMCDTVVAADDARIGFPATRANGTPLNHMWFYEE